MDVMDVKQRVKGLTQAGKWREAQLMCSGLCEANPKDAEAWFILGAIHGQLKEFKEAEACCRHVLNLRDDLPMGHFNLGIALQNQQKFDEAIQCFRRAIVLNPNLAEAHNELGATLQLQGDVKLNIAEEAYRKALVLKPGYPEAHYNLATVLRDMGINDEAVKHLREAVRLRPDLLKAYSALGLLLCELGRPDKAMDIYNEAFRHHADAPELYVQFASMLVDRGESPRAMENFRRALELRPGDADAIAGMAQLFERQGDFEASYALLRPLLDTETESVNVALAYAALARHLDQRDQAIQLMERLLQAGKSASERKAMHFALGKLYDEKKNYERAFLHYRSANELAQGKYDLKETERKFDGLMAAFSAESIARRPRASNKSRLPIFIVGMPRSGTSLVEQILASHPDVHGAGELPDMANLVGTLPGDLGGKMPYPYCVDSMKRKRIDEIAERHLARLAGLSAQATRVTDKMPHNFLQLGLIDMLFPGARIIHCKRDPVDTCLSIYSLPFNANHLYAADLMQLGEYYRQYQRLMAHWKKVLRISLLEVQYEELVANQEAVTRQMVEFCELKWDERCLRFYESDRVVTTPSYDQVRRPLYKKSVARWKNYEQHLAPLLEALEINKTLK